MFSSRLALAAIASTLFASATAELTILAPGGDSLWWGKDGNATVFSRTLTLLLSRSVGKYPRVELQR
jgi:hypothetical protein